MLSTAFLMSPSKISLRTTGFIDTRIDWNSDFFSPHTRSDRRKEIIRRNVVQKNTEAITLHHLSGLLCEGHLFNYQGDILRKKAYGSSEMNVYDTDIRP